MRLHDTAIHTALAALLVASSALTSPAAVAQVIDPGVRQAGTDNGPPPPLAGLTADELPFFQDGLARFSAVKMEGELVGRQACERRRRKIGRAHV